VIERRDLPAAGLLALVALVFGWLATSIAYDDAWITYRYAFNLATGQGFVYNVGERFLGTTAPGYAVVLAIPGAFSPGSIPAASAVLCVAALVAAALGFFAVGRVTGRPLLGFLAGLFFVVNPVTLEAFGGEMLPQLALAVWGLAAQAAGRPTLAVSLACSAAIVRPDGLLVLGIVGLHQTWKARRLPWRQIALAAIVLGLWFGALWIYFGAPLPQTLGAKNAQRVSGIWRPLGMDLVAWFGALSSFGPTIFGSRPAPGFTAFLYLAAAGLLPAMLWFRRWWLVLAWPIVYMVAYRQLHLPFYHWYAVPPLVFLVVCAAAAIDAVVAVLMIAVAKVSRLAERGPALAHALPIAAVLIVVAVILWPLGRYTVALTRAYPNVVERAYASLGQWLSAHTPPTASVGYLEIGIVGYHAQRTIIDPLGLVNPGVAPHVAQRDFLYAYRTYRPDIIVHNPVFFPEFLGIVVDQPWFTAEYEPMATLDGGRDQPLTIYRRRRVR
jgi:hypothetical protein